MAATRGSKNIQIKFQKASFRKEPRMIFLSVDHSEEEGNRNNKDTQLRKKHSKREAG